MGECEHPTVISQRQKVESLQVEVKEHQSNLDKMLLEGKKWAGYKETLSTIESKVSSLEGDTARLEEVEVQFHQEIENVKQRRLCRRLCLALLWSSDESIDNAFVGFNTIITSIKALDEGYSSKNYAKKESSDEESSTSRSEDEEYAMTVRDFKKFFKKEVDLKIPRTCSSVADWLRISSGSYAAGGIYHGRPLVHMLIGLIGSIPSD
ncbi:hypothetical protein Tco_0662238 [Tanacetum coccineum]